MKQRILITGAAGYVAGLVIPDLATTYDLGLTDQKPITTLEPFVQADLSDFEALLGVCQGVDTVLHLAAVA